MVNIKKFLSVLFVLLISFACVFGCNDKPTEKDDFEAINALIAKEYQTISMTVVTKKDDLSLTSSYEIKKEDNKYRLTYATEEYKKIDINNYSIHDKLKKTGELLYEGSSVQVISGEDIGISLSYFSISKYKLDKELFSKYDKGEGLIMGDIKDLSKYINVDGTDGKITIRYSNNAISKIELSYVLNGYRHFISYVIE